MKLSFIVPAYNAEKTLGRCLDSLLQQDLSGKDYEIIVVNDGSTDNTGKVIDQYAKSHSNIRNIEQENKGLSVARNNGCKLSNAKYIWFVDADDTICPNCLSTVVTICEEKQCDLFGVGPSIPYRSDFPKIFDKEKDITAIYSGQEWLLTPQCFIGAWAYIIDRKFWNKYNLSFYPGIFYEDVECMSRAFYHASRIGALSSFSVYNYVQTSGSIMTSNFTFKKASDRITIIQSLRDFNRNIPKKEIRLCFERSCTNLFISCISDFAKSELPVKDITNFIREIPKTCYPTYLYATSLHAKFYQYIVSKFPLVCFYAKRVLHR